MDRRWLTVKETAVYLNLHYKSVYRLVYKRKIPFSKPSGIGIRIDKVELDRLLEASGKHPNSFCSILNQIEGGNKCMKRKN